MSRVLALGLALVALARPVAGQGITARIGGELTGFTGGSVTVPVVVDMGSSGQRLGSYTARIQWDPSVLTLTCSYGEFGTFCDVLPGNFPAAQVNIDSVPTGVLRFTAVSPAGVGGLVTLAQFRFSIAAAQTSALSLSFSEMSAAGTFVALTPVTSGATFCPARGYWGDANADAAVGSFDALLALTAAVGHDVSAYVDPDRAMAAS